MNKGNMIGKVLGIVIACLLVMAIFCGLANYVGSDAGPNRIDDTTYGMDSDHDNYLLMELLENNGANGISPTMDYYLVYQVDLSDVEPGKESETMEQVKEVIERRINALGIRRPIITIQEEGGEWSIAIQMRGSADIEVIKEFLGLVTVLEFRERDVTGNWTPATGTVTVNGEEKELVLSSRYFKENTYVDIQTGRPLLRFEMDETGAQLFKQISTRLIGKRLAIYLGDEPLRGEDGNIIAPTVQTVIEDQGQIDGLSLVDAQQLSLILNAGRFYVPLGRWVEEGQSRVFEPGAPLYEKQVIPAPSVNWPLIGIIVGAALVAGLVIFLVRRRRTA